MKCNCFFSDNANQHHEQGNEEELKQGGRLQAVLKLCSFCGLGGHTSSNCGKRKS